MLGLVGGRSPARAAAAEGCRTSVANGSYPSTLPTRLFGSPSHLYGNPQLATSAYGSVLLPVGRPSTAHFQWWGASGLPSHLVLTLKRLDGAAVPRRIAFDAEHVASASHGTRFWVSEIRFPAPGCWRIEARVGTVYLSPVVFVMTTPHP